MRKKAYNIMRSNCWQLTNYTDTTSGKHNLQLTNSKVPGVILHRILFSHSTTETMYSDCMLTPLPKIQTVVGLQRGKRVLETNRVMSAIRIVLCSVRQNQSGTL